MQQNNVEEYDLEGVTAKLEAMEARRRRRKSHNNEGPEKQQLPVRETTCRSDLAPADLSSGGSDNDSDDGSNSTNSLPSDDDKARNSWRHSQISKRQPGRGRARKLRVTDSLDLSMSVLTLDRPSLQAEAFSSSNTNQQPTRPKLPDEEPKRLLQRSSQQDAHDQAVSGVQPQRNAVRKISRIPRLVQQRRQLQTGTQHADTSVHTQGSLQAPVSVVSYNVPVDSGQNKSTPPSGDCLSVPEPPKQAKLLPSTSHGVPKLSHSTAIAKPRANSTGRLATKSVIEEIDSTTAEERRLLQSLEILDRRLTSVNAPAVAVREGGQQSSQKQLIFHKNDTFVRTNTKNSRSVCTTNGEIDEETIRAAAYGGGTHCKIRQPSSISVRSSSAKRAELSSGVHKARVRVGGALVNDARRNSSTDGSGKHKIVVKKELAHLLFFK